MAPAGQGRRDKDGDQSGQEQETEETGRGRASHGVCGGQGAALASGRGGAKGAELDWTLQRPSPAEPRPERRGQRPAGVPGQQAERVLHGPGRLSVDAAAFSLPPL